MPFYLDYLVCLISAILLWRGNTKNRLIETSFVVRILSRLVYDRAKGTWLYIQLFMSFLPIRFLFVNQIGYSNPQTLTDTSSRIKHGACKGDITLLRPTLFASVPTVLERVSKAVWQQVNSGGEFMRAVSGYNYRITLSLILRNYSTVSSDLFVITNLSRNCP